MVQHLLTSTLQALPCRLNIWILFYDWGLTDSTIPSYLSVLPLFHLCPFPVPCSLSLLSLSNRSVPLSSNCGPFLVFFLLCLLLSKVYLLKLHFEHCSSFHRWSPPWFLSAWVVPAFSGSISDFPVHSVPCLETQFTLHIVAPLNGCN